MTSSVQSTAFQSSARPVDTFVAPPQYEPISDIENLSKILSEINPNLQKFLGTKIEQEVEKEKQEGVKIAIDQVLAEGDLTSAVNKIRKQDGDKAARQLVGGSIFADRAYKTTVSSLYSSQLNSILQNDYDDHKVDTIDSQGNVIQKSLREFSPNSPEFQSWLNNITKIQSDKIFDLGGEIDTEEFTTNITNSIVNINEVATEKHNEFKVERIKNLSVDYLNKASQDWLDGNREESKIHITKFINETRKLGLTGGDATDIYNGLVESIANVGQYYVTTADVEALDDIDDLIIGIGKSIPYGNNNGNLTQHPLWQEKIEPVLDSLEDEIFQEYTQGPKIDKFKRTQQLQNKLKEVNLLPIDTPEQRALYKQEITKLKNNREFSDLNDIFKSNNYPFIEDFTAEILNIRTSMKLRSYRDNESPLEDLAAIKNKIVDLGITDNGILTDLNQAVGIASEYKSIYDIFDNKSKKLFDDIKEFYRSKSKRSGLGTVTMNGITFDLGGGLDSDSLTEKYNTEQEIDQNFEDWIKENYYQTKDGKQIGGPSEADIKQWLTDERKRVEKEVFEFKTENTSSSNNQPVTPPRPLTEEERRNIMQGVQEIEEGRPRNEEETSSQTENQTPGQGNTRFEVSQNNQNLTEQLQNILQQLTGGGLPVTAGGLEGKPRSYTVKSGDTLETIANEFGVELDDLVTVNKIKDRNFIREGQPLTIPAPRPRFIDKYKDKPVPDFGGLAKLIISGESAGHGIYNAFNRGGTDTAGKMDITSKTIAEMKKMQADGTVNAVGAYQFTKGVLEEAREVAGIAEDAIMTPAVQDRLLWAMLTGGKKKPDLSDYLLGRSDDLRKAHQDLANEFAALEGPDGKGMHDDDKAGNLATVKAAVVKAALIKAREQILKELR